MAVPKIALKKWEKVHDFALGMPGAVEATRRSRTSMQPLG
ncbi:hypothetical protein QF037_001888 [Streptomyces canus]|nr:hypothetical protein [Streptomyces canus]